MKISRFELYDELTKERAKSIYNWLIMLPKEKSYPLNNLIYDLFFLIKNYRKKRAIYVHSQIQAIGLYTNLFDDIVD